jgi:hypothetical protein
MTPKIYHAYHRKTFFHISEAQPRDVSRAPDIGLDQAGHDLSAPDGDQGWRAAGGAATW